LSNVEGGEKTDMNAEIERFGNDLSTKEALRNSVKAAGTDYAAIVKIANSNGYTFTLADVNEVAATGELSESQLAGVAGGAWSIFIHKGGGMFIQST
jgi:predicted ribosomally synthesized peptide with nif11-like leader